MDSFGSRTPLGNPKCAAKRARNAAVGRTLGKLGLWRSLWR